MNIRIDCENRKCRETIDGDSVVYCEGCYDAVVEELNAANVEIEELRSEIVDLKEKLDEALSEAKS